MKFDFWERQKEKMAKYQNPLIIRLEVQLKYSRIISQSSKDEIIGDFRPE